MSYQSTLDYIHSESWTKHRNGLERIRLLLHRLGDPQKRLKFVHVAGTNGKGSTCAMLDAVLRRAGYRTGLFTSPYLARFNERIRVDGQEIPDGELERVTGIVRPFAESMQERPSEFELICAIGMVWFAEQKCDIVVLEVGLGGEFDSTNVIDPPECAVITAIGLDHTAMLGNTIPEIARAKAGIIKAGVDVVTWSGSEEADAVFRETCAAQGARLYETDFTRLTVTDSGPRGSEFSFGDIRDLHIPLAGAFQPKNAAVALTAMQVLRQRGWKLSEDDIRCGLAAVGWPGRFELLRESPAFVLDGAHNPHGIRAALESLARVWPGRQVTFLMGAMRDKAVPEMVSLLLPAAERFVAVRPDNPRAMDAESLGNLIRSMGGQVQTARTVCDAVRSAICAAGKCGIVCALGSLYFSEEIREAVRDTEGREEPHELRE